jgi:PAS domain S-box-containing protein
MELPMQKFMKEDDFIVSKTDTKGLITYGNEIFIHMSGYTESELLHAPHNILRHKDMPAIVFKLLWERLKERKAINAYVKNRCRNGDFYWVFANVTPSFNAKGEVIGYYSVRRKPKESALKIIEGIYESLLQVEKTAGINASKELLETTLQNNKVTYDEFIINLQK